MRNKIISLPHDVTEIKLPYQRNSTNCHDIRATHLRVNYTRSNIEFEVEFIFEKVLHVTAVKTKKPHNNTELVIKSRKNNFSIF